MSSNQYLGKVLVEQLLSPGESQALVTLATGITELVCKLEGYPMVYYAGSFAKGTLIRERYDLDIVVYWPSGSSYTLSGIYTAIGNQLKKDWKIVKEKTVSWEIPITKGFHIDVVPGRVIDGTYVYANLYRTDTDTSLKTSIKKHIATVRDSGRCDAIKIIKLWRERKDLPFKKSFLLEMLVIEGCRGTLYTDLSLQVVAALTYIQNNIITVRILDPANSNNTLSEELTILDRITIRQAAVNALAGSWMDLFTPV